MVAGLTPWNKALLDELRSIHIIRHDTTRHDKSQRAFTSTGSDRICSSNLHDRLCLSLSLPAGDQLL
jgi:hypothetical protein